MSGGFQFATAALDRLKAAGIHTGCNTTLNRVNAPDLEGVYEHLRTHGVEAWQVQLTTALGRAADRPEMLLQPWDLLDLMPRIARLKEQARRDGILLTPGNDLGYFGPQETLLRSVLPGVRDHWQGCMAGRFVLGIEADGALKGCLSLQSSHYVGGHVRDRPIQESWDSSAELSFARRPSVEELWGFCRSCEFAEECRGGCTATAHSLFGRRGNNPYCHFRARSLAKQGLRERLVPQERAANRPFSSGRFEIVVEPFDAPDPRPPRPEPLLKVWRESGET